MPQDERSLRKFENPDWTAKGEKRAHVALDHLDTLWINTGTLCNIECVNCYILSSPMNDRLVYMSAIEVAKFLDEAESLNTREIGFTGGEPFMNGDFLIMLEDALSRGFEVLVLTNAMQPMQRPKVAAKFLDIQERLGEKLTVRVSLDHYTQKLHETERGKNTWEFAIKGLDWLAQNGFNITIGGRTCWGESETSSRAGFAALVKQYNWPINTADPRALVLFPEMDEGGDVPEITTACWDILGQKPSNMMCASSRMVVKRKGALHPTVLPCTLLPYEPQFDMGSTLEKASKTSGGMFEKGAVKLCHPHCARFCVLGGGSCS